MFQDETSAEAWSRLGLYLCRDVLESRYFARHGGELNAGKTREIIAHFEQAREYFASAASAGILAGPLEQYYGALSFARGMVLYLQPKAREANLKKGHGLAATVPAGSRIEDMRLSVQMGTFDEFLDATGNAEEISFDAPYVGGGPGVTRFLRHLKRPPIGAEFSLLELVARIPAVRAHYEEAYCSNAHCFLADVSWFMGTVKAAVIRDRAKLPEQDYLVQAFQFESANPYPLRRDSDIELSRTVLPDTSIKDYIPHAIETLSGERVLIAPFPEGWALSALAAYLAAAYALSTLVRYHPTSWARLLGREHGDRVVPVLDRLRISIQRDFVRLVLRELDGVIERPKNMTETIGISE